MSHRPVRFDRGLRRVLCGRLRCPETLGQLVVPRGLLRMAPAGYPLVPWSASARIDVEYRLSEDGVWRLTPYAESQRRARAQGTPRRLRDADPERKRNHASKTNTLRLHDRWLLESRGPIGAGAEVGRLRRNPPLPVVIECPRCGSISEVTEAMLVEVCRVALDRRRLQKPPVEPWGELDREAATEPAARRRRGKGRRRGGRGRRFAEELQSARHNEEP